MHQHNTLHTSSDQIAVDMLSFCAWVQLDVMDEKMYTYIGDIEVSDGKITHNSCE